MFSPAMSREALVMAFCMNAATGLAGSSPQCEVAKLAPDDHEPGDRFGYATDHDGDTLVIGMPRNGPGGSGGPQHGQVFVYVRNGPDWQVEAMLSPSDGGPSSDWFGHALDLMGDTLAIGAPSDNVNGQWSGSAYIFTRSAGQWTEVVKLVPNDASPDDLFGAAVALMDDVVIIGAPWDKGRIGAAYIFARHGAEWVQHVKLTAFDVGRPSSLFGGSVAADGTDLSSRRMLPEAAPTSDARTILSHAPEPASESRNGPGRALNQVGVRPARALTLD